LISLRKLESSDVYSVGFNSVKVQERGGGGGGG